MRRVRSSWRLPSCIFAISSGGAQANDHIECRFLWLEADNAPFLTDRFNIFMLPTIVCIENNKVKTQHNGLNDLDGETRHARKQQPQEETVWYAYSLGCPPH